MRGAPTHLALVATALLSACSDPGPELDGDEGEAVEVDPETCLEPASALVDGVAVPEASEPETPRFCPLGWGQDLPRLDASWTVVVRGDIGGFPPAVVRAHPEGGVLVLTDGVLAHYAQDGALLWADETLGAADRAAMVVEPAGTILAATWPANKVARFSPDGSSVVAVELPFLGAYNRVHALARWGEDVLVSGLDTPAGDNMVEVAFMRVGPGGEALVYKSTPSRGLPGPFDVLAVDELGTVVFGGQGTLLAAESGGVLGSLIPSVGSLDAAASAGEGFYAVGAAPNPASSSGPGRSASFGRHASEGAEQWRSRLDLVEGSSWLLAVDARPGAGLVACGAAASRLNTAASPDPHPLVLASDEDGEPLWHDLIAANGSAVDLEVGDGAVYVAGTAEAAEADTRIVWLRRYDGP